MPLIVFLAGLASTAHAQFTRFQIYDDGQGLRNLVVSALGQERDGTMLLGTQVGLFRYDGGTITRYGVGLPASAWIRQIVFDNTGRLWILSIDGLFMRERGAASPFRRLDLGATFTMDDASLAITADQVLVVVGGQALAATLRPDGAIGRFAPAFEAPLIGRHPELAHPGFVAPDRDGGILLGCGTAVCRVVGDEVERYDVAAGVPAATWQAALRTEDGTIWLRSLDHIAFRRRGQGTFTASVVPNGRGLYVDRPLVLIGDRHGGVLTQNDDGLLDRTPSGWRELRSHAGGLPRSRIWSLMFDREGSLWAGSEGEGAFRSLGLGAWEHWTAPDGLASDEVWAIAHPNNGPVWVATGSGTAPLDNPVARISGATYAIAASRGGRLWVAPLSGPLLRRDAASGTIERFPSIGVVLQALIDPSDRLWLATRTALFMIDDADAPAAAIRPTLALDQRRLQLATDDGGVLWAVSRGGLFRADRAGRVARVADGGVVRSTPLALGIAPNGDVWVATTAAGVLRFRVHGSVVEALPPVRAPTIGSDQVVLVQRGRGGVMWVGTDQGLDRWDGHRWQHVAVSDGLLSDDIDEFAALADRDGTIWFGSSHGLSHLLDPARPPPSMRLRPIITGVQFGDRALPTDGRSRAPWSAAPLVVHVADPDYLPGNGIVFRYRFRGVDPAWHTTTLREIQYAGLPAASLRFEVVAVDPLHGTVSDPVGFDLRIHAPWWRSWPCLALYALGFAATVAAAWQVRVRLLLKQRRRLEGIVQARTAEIEEARRELQRLALLDGLTGLPNRRAIMEHLETVVRAAADRPEDTAPVALLLCDIDHFKSINDGFGHLAGDAVLAAFGERLRRTLASGEAAGRYGGEEFLLVLVLAPDQARARVRLIAHELAHERYLFGEARRRVTVSGGLVFQRPGETALELIGRADQALYTAKESGRDRILEPDSDGPVAGRPRTREGSPVLRPERHAEGAYHDGPELERLFRARRDLRRDLHAALAGGEFELHFQPVVDVARHRVILCEALLRWHSPTRGAVSPATFIPVAEEIGMMPAIGDWVLRRACRIAATWPAELRLAINLSPVQFRQPELVERIRSALDDAGLSPERLEIEVTETAIIDDVANATAVLGQLRSIGVTVALDDFGTGYSSLSFLRLLPFDRIKIDRSFVADLGLAPEAASIIGALTGLAGELGVAVTAEGIETASQADLLRAIGCTAQQGYLIGRPCSATALGPLLAQFAARGAVPVPA